MPTSTPRRLTGACGALLLAVTLAACGTTPSGQAGGTTSQEPKPSASTATQSQAPVPDPVKLTSNVPDGARKVKVDTLVTAAASDGALTKVKLAYTGTDGKGQKVKGTVSGSLNKDKTRWTAGERLEPSAKYTLTMTGRNSSKQTSTSTSSFKTQSLSLSEQTFPTAYPLKGMEVGVGMPVVLTFDIGVKNKAAFEKNLHVTTVPKQTGSWRWFNDRTVHYRPKTYWKPGTKVVVDANLNGVDAGNGIYGQQSVSTSFKVGRSMITRVNLATDVATVYRDGKAVRRIYVSGGKPGWSTRSGIKLIMGKEYNKKMTNEMIGAEEDYSLTAQYAMRITNSGEFLHSAPWNAAHLGRRNASHGCVGMSNADAGWLYERVLVGDPVVTTGSNRGVEDGNGYSDWNLSWSQWKKGSAL